MVKYGGTLVDFLRIYKRFGNVVALNRVSFSIPNGVIGLIGPNGAGKTTSINIMTGLMNADEGEVRVFGLDPMEDGEKIREKMGLLLENVEYPPELTGGRLIKLVSEIYGTNIDSDYLKGLVKYFEMEGAWDRKIYTYSAGMMKRLALITAFANPDSDLIILDEPSANLDIGGRLRLMDLIFKFKKEKRNILISSHILPELEMVCDYYILLNKGIVVDQGPISKLISQIKIEEFVLLTSNNDKFLENLGVLKGIVQTYTHRNWIYIKTRYPNRILRELAELADEIGVEIYEFRPTDTILTKFFKERIYHEENNLLNQI